MLAAILAFLGVALACLAAAIAIIGSVKAAPLVPVDAERSTTVIHTITETLRAQKLVVAALRQDADKRGVPPNDALPIALTTMSEVLEKWGPKIPQPYDYQEVTKHAATVRIWLAIGFLLVFGAAGCQVAAVVLAR